MAGGTQALLLSSMVEEVLASEIRLTKRTDIVVLIRDRIVKLHWILSAENSLSWRSLEPGATQKLMWENAVRFHGEP